MGTGDARAGVDLSGLLDTQRAKEYEGLADTLIERLRAPIEAEVDGAKEGQVRRKANDAGESIKEFLTLPAERTRGRASAAALTSAISLLGNFYRANGPRAKLTDDAREAILGAITDAEIALEDERQARIAGGKASQ